MAKGDYKIFFIPKDDFDKDLTYTQLMSNGYKNYTTDQNTTEVFNVKPSPFSYANKYFQNLPNPRNIKFYIKADEWAETNIIYNTSTTRGIYLSYVIRVYDINEPTPRLVFTGYHRIPKKYDIKSNRLFIICYDFLDVINKALENVYVKVGKETQLSCDSLDSYVDHIYPEENIENGLELMAGRDAVKLMGLPPAYTHSIDSVDTVNNYFVANPGFKFCGVA